MKLRHFCLTLFTSVIALAAGSATATSQEPRPIDSLKGLDRLVGDWIAEPALAGGKPVVRTIQYRWGKSGRILEATSERRVGDDALGMRISYLWDAPAAKIRAWVVGSDGSWGQAEVEITNDAIRLDTRGVSADGQATSVISMLREGPGDTRTETWTHMTLGDRALPDPPVIVWHRKGQTASAVATLSGGVSWPEIRARRQEALDRYLRTASDGLAWFSHAMHGEQAGTPFLLFRSLPELAPDLWGPPEERLARFGFIDDPRDRDRPLPLGLGWVLDPVRGDEATPRHHTVTLTCAACHVGRVRTPGELLLVGAPNTQIDVRKFRWAIESTAERMLSEPALEGTIERLAKLIRSKPEGYFFRGRYGIDARAEAQEREAFVDPQSMAGVLKDFARRVGGGRLAVVKETRTSYSRPNAPPLNGGTPGQSDGTGDLIPKLLLFRELMSPPMGDDPLQRFLARPYAEMPASATATDNLSVWNQWDRPFGQLDASIKAPLIRNVAAMTAVVGSATRLEGRRFTPAVNVRNADVCARFTAWLPPPPYPFDVDLVKARRGEALFREHCGTCHRAGNGAVYGAKMIGTDANRARVLSEAGRDLLVGSFKSAIPADYVATDPEGRSYRPAALSDDEIINDRVSPERQGYAAGPLDGVWARAPYLHNGSVPTLRHLLAPRDGGGRPATFVRGSDRYDAVNVGFRWDLREQVDLLGESRAAAVFNTGWDGASSGGHDRDVTIDGRLHRLDWSGPGRASELDDLIEYLKTL